MKNFDIVTVGGAVRDFTFYTDKGKVFHTPENLTAQRMLAFEYGAKINPKEVYINFGGGGANAAVSLTRLGYKVAALARLGKDEIGREVLNNLKKEKIAPDFIQFDAVTPNGFSFILSTDKKEREHVAFAYRGAAQNFIFSRGRVNDLKTKWLYLTSLSGRDWLKNTREIFRFAQVKNVKVMWNPGNFQLAVGKKVLADFLRLTQVLILNKDEAIELALSGIRLGRKNPNFLNRPLYLLNILQEWGPKIVVITDGPKGAWAYDGKKIYREKIIKAKVVDTTGVGDCFGSSFLAGFIYAKGDIKKALKWGMVNCASVVAKVGAQNTLLSRAELLKKINNS